LPSISTQRSGSRNRRPRSAGEDRIPQVAGSLTFTTMLSLVPLATVAFALFTAFPDLRFVPDVAAGFSGRPSDAVADQQSRFSST
jgi:uncharacterized BrkB/YihY/UPF0761 family membrane protein